MADPVLYCSLLARAAQDRPVHVDPDHLGIGPIQNPSPLPGIGATMVDAVEERPGLAQIE